MSKGRCLVVGGAGYVGGPLTDLLVTNGYCVTVYDSLVYEDRFLKPVQFVYGDVRDREKLAGLLPQFDVVFWLAAIVGDGACAIDRFLSRSINTESIEWLVEHYGGRIVFPSTCSVYGINNGLIDETAEPHPLSVYAQTKLAAERYILAHARDPLVFRLGTLYGLGDAFARVRFDLVVNVLTMRAAIGEPLIVNGGEQWRPLLHVRDVGRAMLFGFERGITGLFNLHNENRQIRDIADDIARVVPDARIERRDVSFEDARNYRVTSEAFVAKGWRPAYDIADGIKTLYWAIKEHRIKNVHDPVFSNVAHLEGIKTIDWCRG